MSVDSVFPPADECSRSSRPKLSNELAKYYASRVHRHAARYARHLPHRAGLGVVDLMSAGYEGLLAAHERYDSARGENFEAYIDHRIRGAILDELRDADPLTRDQRHFARRVGTARRALVASLGRDPEPSEIAAALHMPLSAFQLRLSKMAATASRSETMQYDEDRCDSYEAVAVRPDELAEGSERRQRLLAGIAQLRPRQQAVLQMFYTHDKNLREIGEVLAVTESRASQIHSEAIKKLRELISKE